MSAPAPQATLAGVVAKLALEVSHARDGGGVGGCGEGGDGKQGDQEMRTVS
jgi:hypothetical protein